MLARSGLLAILVLSTCAAGPWEYRWAHPTPEGNAVHAFAFPTAARGYAVGLFGAVLRTDDGGASWERLDPILQGPHLYDVVALDHSTLVAVGQGIFRSTDGGESFVQILDATASPLRDVALVPGGALTAAGAAGRVWHSTDGGLDWVDVGPGTGEIRRHTWTSATTGFVVGDAIAMRTSDGGQSWSSFIEVPFFGFNDVFFTDALTGYVLEDFGYASTTDGGESWTLASAGRAGRVSVRSDGVAVACGSFSSDVPRVSIDGGLGWEPLEPPLAEPFEIFQPEIPAILNTDAGLLVGASKSRIVFGEPLEIVAAPGADAPLTGEPLSLAAPRPNPSAGAVSTSFVLTERADVTVTVHDVTGRMLDVLMHGTRGAGSHAVAWDGRTTAGWRVSAGIYFLRLAVGERMVSRKVIRLR